MIPYPFRDRYEERQAEAIARDWKQGGLEERIEHFLKESQRRDTLRYAVNEWRKPVRQLLYHLARRLIAEGRMERKNLRFIEDWDTKNSYGATWFIKSRGIHRRRWLRTTKGNNGDYVWECKLWVSVDVDLDSSLLCKFSIGCGNGRDDNLRGIPKSQESLEKAFHLAYKAGPISVRTPLYPDRD